MQKWAKIKLSGKNLIYSNLIHRTRSHKSCVHISVTHEQVCCIMNLFLMANVAGVSTVKTKHSKFLKFILVFMVPVQWDFHRKDHVCSDWTVFPSLPLIIIVVIIIQCEDLQHCEESGFTRDRQTTSILYDIFTKRNAADYLGILHRCVVTTAFQQAL